MQCFNCGADMFTVDDNYPCDCGKTIEVLTCCCNECGTIFKTLNGAIISDSIINKRDIEDFAEDCTSNLKELMAKTSEETPCNSASMLEYVHHCLECNSISYEINIGLYECSKCGFKWEVVSGQ